VVAEVRTLFIPCVRGIVLYTISRTGRNYLVAAAAPLGRLWPSQAPIHGTGGCLIAKVWCYIAWCVAPDTGTIVAREEWCVC